MMVDHLLIGEITVYEQDPGTSTMPDISGSEVRPDILDIVGMFFFGSMFIFLRVWTIFGSII